MTDLRTLVEPLKREVAVPGTYADAFPSTSDDDLAATLADAFGEAQLFGFFGDVVLEVNTGASPTTYETSKPLSAAGQALVVMYAGLRMLRSQIRSLSQSATYKAGSVEYSYTNLTTVIRDDMKALRDRLDALVIEGKRSGRVVHVLDVGRRLTAYTRPLGAFHSYEAA